MAGNWKAVGSGNRDGLWSVEAENGELIFFGMEAARAHLFAAAPEMLEKLREVTEHLANVTGADSRPDSDSGYLVREAREIIAKAQGPS